MSENGGFSTFMQFSMKLVEAGAIMVDPRDSVGSFNLKNVRERALFSYSGLAARCGELATVEMVGGRNMLSLGVVELVHIPVKLFV